MAPQRRKGPEHSPRAACSSAPPLSNLHYQPLSIDLEGRRLAMEFPSDRSGHFAL
jgi:hypothetical protein